ncbi:hypothetical protein [Massilibacteroides sp.]|uniref:hypothetical protein n=1 Tax=Massilibacteroides sp. TaxID=2034766 RepID=UPI002613864C|nr:hypothetical protein [Massilibacteroides sp.]MDD4515051.1 hypothetical protein [Massilibacteroides sp.]
MIARIPIIVLFAMLVTTITAQKEYKPFGNMSVSVNVGTLGVGVQLASSVTPALSFRTGLSLLKYSYDYEYKGVVSYKEYEMELPVPLNAKANMVNGLLLADIFPFKKSPFHIIGGVYWGTANIINVVGEADYSVEITHELVIPAKGVVSAKLETNKIKPYVGLGFTRSFTKNNRFGFTIELGAMFHGTPKVIIEESTVVTDYGDFDIDGELNDMNKFLKDIKVYPLLNFQLNFRLF